MEFTSLIGVTLWALIPGFMARKRGRSFLGYFFLSFIISPLIVMIIVACLKKKEFTDTEAHNDNKPMVSEDAATEFNEFINHVETNEDPSGGNASVSEQEAFRKIKFCRHCGFELIEGSSFCSRCGGTVEKE